MRKHGTLKFCMIGIVLIGVLILWLKSNRNDITYEKLGSVDSKDAQWSQKFEETKAVKGDSNSNADLVRIEAEAGLSPATESIQVVAVEVMWGMRLETISAPGLPVLFKHMNGDVFLESVTEANGRCRVQLNPMIEDFLVSAQGYGITESTQVHVTDPTQPTMVSLLLQPYGELTFHFENAPTEINLFRVKVQLKGEVPGDEGGDSAWIPIDEDRVLAGEIHVPAFISFRINLYSHMGLLLWQSETLSVLPNETLNLIGSLNLVPDIRLSFQVRDGSKQEWRKVSLTLIEENAREIPLGSTYLRFPGSIVLQGILKSNSQIVAMCAGYAPSLGQMSTEYGEVTFMMEESATVAIWGLDEDAMIRIKSEEKSIFGLGGKRLGGLVCEDLEDRILFSNLGPLVESYRIGEYQVIADLRSGEDISLFEWPPSKAFTLSEEIVSLRGLPTTYSSVELSMQKEENILYKRFWRDYSIKGSKQITTRMKMPDSSVELMLRILPRDSSLDWIILGPFLLSPESKIEIDGVHVERTRER